MYPISDALKQLFLDGNKKCCKLTLNNATTENFVITEADILSDSLTIDRYCSSGNKIEVGSAIAAELTLTLLNNNDKFSGITFEGADVGVEIGFRDVENGFIPCGKFTVDEPPRNSSHIKLKALDYMMRFDRKVDFAKISFPISVKNLLVGICGLCEVEISDEINLDSLPNIDQTVKAPSSNDLIYRQLLQWIAQLTGTCAFMDWEGKLRLTWFASSSVTLDPTNRYIGGSVDENDITITGVTIKSQNSTVTSGNSTYPLVIEDNQLLYSEEEAYLQSIADNIFKSVGTLTYRPFKCNAIPMPFLYPLDIVSYRETNGNVVQTVITNHNFGVNIASALSAIGETAVKNNYSAAKGLTKNEVDAAIKEALKDVDAKAEHVHLKYSPYENGVDVNGNAVMTDNPTADTEYLGVCATNSTEAPKTPSSYKWAKIRGADGYTPVKDKDYFDGDDGEPGRGVVSVETQYFRSTSSTALTGGSWSSDMPEWVEGTYLWKREVTTYENPSGRSEGTPVLDTSWNILSGLKEDVSVTEAASKELNETLANALGLYVTEQTVSGSKIRYYHTNPVLSASKSGDTILVLNANGFGVCKSGWNGGNPQFAYGATFDGKAVWDILTANTISADLINAGKIKSIDGAKVQTVLDLDTGELTFLLDGYYLRIAAGTTGVDGEQRIGGLSLSQQYGLSSFETKGFTFTCEELRYMDMMYLYKKANGELPEDSYEAAIVDPYYSEVNPQNIKTKDVHCKEIHIFNDDLGGWYTLSELLMAINDNVTSLSETVCSLQSKVIELENALGQDHEHVYTSSVTSQPTCENAGVRTYSCGCGHSYTESIPALGHIDGDGDAYCDRCGELVGKLKLTATYGASGKTSQDVYHMASGVDGTGTYYGTSLSIEVPDTLFKPLYFYANAGTGRVITQITFSGMQSETKTAAQLVSDGYLSTDHRTLNYPFPIIKSHGGKSISATVYFAAESSGGDSGGGDDTTYYTIATSVSPSGAGSVSGGGSYASGTDVTVTATSANGYSFSHWNITNNDVGQTVENVSTDDTWNITATANVTLTAVFTSTSGGSGSSEPTYAVDTIVDGVLYIGTNTTSIASNAYFEHAQSAKITRVVIPFGVTSIGTQAFRGCSNIESIVIPSSVTEIKALAFFDCKKLSDVYYGGSQSSWNSISISTMSNGNSCLTDANIHYNS